MFITNNHASFYLWTKENLVKDQKVLRYYDHDRSWTGFDLDLGHTFTGGVRNSATFCDH